MPETPPPVPRSRRSCLIPGLIGLLTVVLVVAGLWFWFNRPIEPVRLSAEEKAAVEAKVEALQVEAPAEPQYEKGSREIVLSERELNGLLNEHTALGDKLKFELATDAVHARLETDLDPGLPVVGGKRLKARARFFVKTDEGVASLVMDDLTVWGVSLPNDWLAQLKGRDLLDDILGGGKGGKIAGVEEVEVKPGQIKIRLKE